MSPRDAQLEKVRANIATPEEMEELSRLDGPDVRWDKPEQFLKVIMRIPKVRVRLRCWSIKAGFTEKAEELEDPLKTVGDAIEEVRQCRALKPLLSVLLCLGNHMNGGTPKGQADGFALEDLSKMSVTKDLDNKTSLLEYAVALLHASQVCHTPRTPHASRRDPQQLGTFWHLQPLLPKRGGSQGLASADACQERHFAPCGRQKVPFVSSAKNGTLRPLPPKSTVGEVLAPASAAAKNRHFCHPGVHEANSKRLSMLLPKRWRMVPGEESGIRGLRNVGEFRHLHMEPRILANGTFTRLRLKSGGKWRSRERHFYAAARGCARKVAFARTALLRGCASKITKSAVRRLYAATRGGANRSTNCPVRQLLARARAAGKISQQHFFGVWPRRCQR